jgi:hypothetical protein
MLSAGACRHKLFARDRDGGEKMRYRWSDTPVGLRRARAVDASAGAPGERSQGGSQFLPQVGERRNGAAPTAGGVEEQPFDQGRRRVRLIGGDQETGLFGAELWLPQTQGGYGSSPAQVGDARIGAAALDHPERTRDGCEEISAIAELQRRLNAHYAR